MDKPLLELVDTVDAEHSEYKTTVTFRVSVELKKRIVAEAERRRMTPSKFMEKMTEAYIPYCERKILEKRGT